MLSRNKWLGFRPWERHSLVLLVAGLVYMAIGFSYIFSKPTGARYQALYAALVWLPMEGWGVVFFISGALAFISARWPPFTETWGYMVLTGLSTLWGGFYLVGIVVHNSPWSNITGAMTWGLVGFLWWAISGLLNPVNAGLARGPR